jgi:hypothetical protein
MFNTSEYIHFFNYKIEIKNVKNNFKNKLQME